MNHDELMGGVLDILRHRLNWPHLAGFGRDARLNEDLYLDSILMLQLILHIELDLGIEVPDDTLIDADFATVGQLVDLLGRLSRRDTFCPAQPRGVLHD